jgi:capsular polysaccharide transport system permease protein
MRYLLWFDPRRLALALLALPMALAAAYFAFFAADRYVSESIVTVRQAQGNGGGAPGIAMFISGLNPPAREDTLYLRQYMHSLELLRRLDQRLQLRAHFERQGGRDPLYRLYRGTSQEWFLEYYRSRVEVAFDDTASLLTVRTQGFDAPFAQALNAAILEESEHFVNAFAQRMAREQMKFAEGELAHAADRLKAAQGELMAFQAHNAQLDPVAQARTAGAIEGELQGQLTKVEAELRTLKSYLNDDAYPVQALQHQIAALRAQLGAEQARATRGGGDRRLSKLAMQFQELTAQTAFAQDAYKLALTALENARIDAARKIKSLAVIEPPSRPDSALLPRPFYSLATLFIVCGLLYGVLRLTLATIREHHD